MKKKFFPITAAFVLASLSSPAQAQEFKLTPTGYFKNYGVDVMAFDDIYPEGHQGGVCIIMNGNRVATNGDLRFEATPGQWQPVPKQLNRKIEDNSITATLCYPDSSRHLTGFNPMIYPDFQFNYTVKVEGKSDHVEVTVDLDRPVPQEFLGKVGFNLEFFPGTLFGKPWIMDNQSGIFPQQPNSPLTTTNPNYLHTGNYHPEGQPLADMENLIGKGYSPIVADDIISEPYAVGKKFTSRPDDPYNKITIESLTSDLKLYDGRMNHNNGWFVLRSEIAPGVTKGAVKWIITPAVMPNWIYPPVIQTSQIGYHPNQPKEAIIEMDTRDNRQATAQVIRIDSDKEQVVKTVTPTNWGKFLRYNYLKVNFSDVKESGLYQIKYGDSVSPIFRIDENVYDRGVWQPVLEYFLPVQMCHMRVNEKYRVWHDACHMDDARMAPAHNHIDGYNQKPGLSKYKEGDVIPGVNIGGWHDAGDFDLRIESQAGEAYILSLAYEAFHPEIDVTSINQINRVTEIHQADGKNDLLQQVENGALSVVNSYLALGRLYRGIICGGLRQYVLLGDAAAMTDGKLGNEDDRWLFTENNPAREFSTAANLAATSRVLKGFNDTLSIHCLNIAREIFQRTGDSGPHIAFAKIQAAVELYLATDENLYKDFLLDNKELIVKQIERTGWYTARVEQRFAQMKDKKAQAFSKDFRKALVIYKEQLNKEVVSTPYGVPYRPHIWGAGWDIQGFGFRHYFLASAYPDIFNKEPIFNALNFVLGCHPGSNQESFASGVGAASATIGYGLNRADWSYIPGGVISGTALIRPDFPELLHFPFLWQQKEYVLGGGSSHYMFLVLAVQQMVKE
ncbi:glycoside hydrolase family 9 protein [uncultured Bacteroides sp.]|uniref:glycoside hydrolase family 9 protein n=1 Tax=uncultured Bacteroides sp. TaxID=162156 RepID=UPI0025932367|nr:glycoside hydrolase family 9 protein [uncultured Bacteroides sp.]